MRSRYTWFLYAIRVIHNRYFPTVTRSQAIAFLEETEKQLARRIADIYELKYTGTLGVLIKAKQAGYLKSIAPVIRELRNQGMWLTEQIVNKVIQLAGE